MFTFPQESSFSQQVVNNENPSLFMYIKIHHISLQEILAQSLSIQAFSGLQVFETRSSFHVLK